MNDPTTVVIADDHPLFLEGISSAIVARYPTLRIVGTASNGGEAVDRVREQRPDLAILDIKMPEMDGIDAAVRIREIDPEIRIILLTTFNETELLQKGLNAGIIGYILKESPIEEIIESIISAGRGNLSISAKAALNLREIVRKAPSSDADAGGNDDRSAAHEQLKELTSRERQVLDALLKGMSTRQIAETVFLSEGTVRNYIHHIYEVVGIHTRGELFVWASENLPRRS
jgi:DNA-binding NarL/FixJ family response regulator